MSVFNSPNRDEFFLTKFKLPYYDLYTLNKKTGLPQQDSTINYAIYDCFQIPEEQIKSIQSKSELVGKFFENIWGGVKSLPYNKLRTYGIPAKLTKLVQTDELHPFAMRIGWAWGKEPKIMEVNSQTPSFWIEPEIGNKAVAENFQLKEPTPNSLNLLKKFLNQAIEKHAKHLGKPVDECHVAFCSFDCPEDMATMKFLASNCEYKNSVCSLGFLNLSKDRHLIDTLNQKQVDIIFLWYPLEYFLYDADGNGKPLLPRYLKSIQDKKFSAVNFGSGFALQSKGILAYATENFGIS